MSSVFTLRLTDEPPKKAPEEEPKIAKRWYLTAELPDNPGHETAGSPVPLHYPVTLPIEKHLRWYLETYPVQCPWKVENPSIIQDYIQQYAIGLFRQLEILHGIGISPGIDNIIVEIYETGLSPSSNVHAIFWEVLEIPSLWDEVWAVEFPPNSRGKTKAIPTVMVRRTVPPAQPLFQDNDSFFSTYSDESDFARPRLGNGHFRAITHCDRRQIVIEQSVHYMYGDSRTPAVLGTTITVKCFRILLVVARRVDAERDPSLPGKQTRLDHDPDASLIYEPLLVVIEKLKEDFDVQLEVCRPGTWHGLQSILEHRGAEYYDMVHFDMHGGVDVEKGAGLYFMASEEEPNSPEVGTNSFVLAQDIGELLESYGIVLVALNACESGRAEPLAEQTNAATDGAQNRLQEEQDGLLSSSAIQINLAKVLVQCGIPSVLAASFQVSSSFVTTFYESFYVALLQPKSNVCKAVSTARRAAMKDKDRKVAYGLVIELDDWIVPVLYQSHDVSVNLLPQSKGLLGKQTFASRSKVVEPPTQLKRSSFLRRLVNKGLTSKQKEESNPSESCLKLAKQNPNRMHGRGLELLYVESLLLSPGSRKVLMLSGKYGIGKTHFIKGLGKHWYSTNFLATEPIYVDCFAHPEWRVGDIFRTIVKGITGLDYSASALEEAQQALRESRKLIIIDNVIEENLKAGSSIPNEKVIFKDFINSFDANMSIMILASRDDLSYALQRGTKNSVRSWELAERNEEPIHEFAIELLKQLGYSQKKRSFSESHDLRLVLHLLDYNPLTIKLFFKALLKAGNMSSMLEASRTVLNGAIELPLVDPETRMGAQAHEIYTDLEKLVNGQQLQKLLLCMAPFSMTIPCGLNDDEYFPSAKSYIGWLILWGELRWNPETSESRDLPPFNLDKDSALLRAYTIESAEPWVKIFKTLIEHLIRSQLVGFTPQDLKDESLYAVQSGFWEYLSEGGDPSSDTTGKLLMSLKYLWINPVLSHYLRNLLDAQNQDPKAKPPPHGLRPSKLKCAYASYYNQFSMSAYDEHAASRTSEPPASVTSAPAPRDHPSKFIFQMDTANMYGAAYAAMSLGHPTLRWQLLPTKLIADLNVLTVRAFVTYKPLAMAYFTEKHLLDLNTEILTQYDLAPGAERGSITPLRTAAALSHGECTMLFTIGRSEYSDIEVDREFLIRRTKRALKLGAKLNELLTGRRDLQTTQDRWLECMLEDVQGEAGENRRTRRLLGEDGWDKFLASRMETFRVAAAIKGGVHLRDESVAMP